MSNGYMVNNKRSNKQRKFESKKQEVVKDIIGNDILRELKIKTPPTLGPRRTLYHYVYDLNWSIDKSVKEIIKQFPALDKETVLIWLKEKKEMEEGKKQQNDGR